MQTRFVCPYWGCENDTADTFLRKVLAEGYEGVEINLPASTHDFTQNFIISLQEIRNSKPDFIFIAQQVLGAENETVDAHINRLLKRLTELAALQPQFINSHTGKDFFSFDDNCSVIEAVLNFSIKSGVRILHETHRGRFSFHAAGLLAYLKKFPEMELVGDFSHFCTVSESMMEDQESIIQQIIPQVSHLHARVGNEQSAQVNDPAAPEWKNHLSRFISWWHQIITTKENQGWKEFTITPEHGPFPYMPQAPFTKMPLSDQWSNNIFIRNALKKSFVS